MKQEKSLQEKIIEWEVCESNSFTYLILSALGAIFSFLTVCKISLFFLFPFLVLCFLVFFHLYIGEKSISVCREKLNNLRALQRVEPALPMVKALFAQTEVVHRQNMKKRLRKRFEEESQFILTSPSMSVGEACEFLKSCTPETQYHCMELLFHLSVFDSMVAVDRMKELRKHMRGLHPYVVDYFERYYGALELGWNSEARYANIDSSQKERCLKKFGLEWLAKESDVHYSYVKQVRYLQCIIHFTDDEGKRKKAEEKLESLVDSYCVLFGLKHRKKFVILNSAYKDAQAQVLKWKKIIILEVVLSVVLLASLVFMGWWLAGAGLFLLSLPLVCSSLHLWEVADDGCLEREKKLGREEGLFIPFIVYVCNMNPFAREHQLEILKESYSDRIELCLDNKVEYADVCSLASRLSQKDYDTRGRLLTLLFRLVVLDDGIKNDEWYFLQSVIAYCHLSKQYVDYLNNRYGPLRTESDYQHLKEKSKSSQSIGKSGYYATLGVKDGADELTVKKAYRALVMQHHPDLPKNANRKIECEAMMAKLNEAYEKICG